MKLLVGTPRATTMMVMGMAMLLVMRNITPSSSLVVNPSMTKSTAMNKQRDNKVALKMSDVAAELPRGGDGNVGGGTDTIPSQIFNLVKSIVGSGVLSLPAGIAAFGSAPSAAIPGCALIALMGGVSAYTFMLIGRVCSSTQSTSYSQAWDKTVGTKSSWIIALSCLVDCFAGNLSYSMILADTFASLMASLGLAVTRTQSLLGVTATILLPLCFMKNLSSLAPFSLVGIMGMLYTMAAMMVRYFGGTYALPAGKFLSSVSAQPAFGTVGASGVLSAKSLILMCMLSNAYIAHFNAPKFYRELKNNTMPRFLQVTGWSFGISVLIYSVMSAVGFLTFGTACDGLILNNYSTKDLIMSISNLAVTVSVIFSYPLIFVGTRDSLLDLLKISESKRSNALLNKVTLGVMGIVTILAAKLTDLGFVASIGGATFGTALVFIYPAIMLMKSLKMQSKKSKESWLALSICASGVIMGAIGTIQAIQGVGV